MQVWQLVLLAFLVLLPLALLVDFWPDRERLSARGAPLPREWQPRPPAPPVDDEHH